MDDLVAFVRERLDEDERTARAAADVHPNISTTGEWVPAEDGVAHAEWGWVFQGAGYGATHLEDELGAHIARHDPARVLREVKAKRALIADLLAQRHFLTNREWYGCRAVAEPLGDPDLPDVLTGEPCSCGRDADVERRLRLLAAVWAAHPGFRPEWEVVDG